MKIKEILQKASENPVLFVRMHALLAFIPESLIKDEGLNEASQQRQLAYLHRMFVKSVEKLDPNGHMLTQTRMALEKPATFHFMNKKDEELYRTVFLSIFRNKRRGEPHVPDARELEILKRSAALVKKGKNQKLSPSLGIIGEEVVLIAEGAAKPMPINTSKPRRNISPINPDSPHDIN